MCCSAPAVLIEGSITQQVPPAESFTNLNYIHYLFSHFLILLFGTLVPLYLQPSLLPIKTLVLVLFPRSYQFCYIGAET